MEFWNVPRQMLQQEYKHLPPNNLPPHIIYNNSENV